MPRAGARRSRIAVSVFLNRTEVAAIFFTGLEVINEVIELQNADDRDVEVLLYLLNAESSPVPRSWRSSAIRMPAGSPPARRMISMASPDRRSGCNDIIQNQYPAVYRRADQSAAFTMILGLFAIETEWKIDIVVLCQCRGC